MGKTTGIYPGSFDPVTRGHMDIIERAAKTVDHLIVGVLINSAKSPLFTVAERVELLKKVTDRYDNVEVRSFDGLLVDFARECNAQVIIRGLRAVTDFEYELQMSQTNRKIAPEIDTIFFTTSLEYAYLSSSVVKEVAMYRGNISDFVAEPIERAVYEKISKEQDLIKNDTGQNLSKG